MLYSGPSPPAPASGSPCWPPQSRSPSGPGPGWRCTASADGIGPESTWSCDAAAGRPASQGGGSRVAPPGTRGHRGSSRATGPPGRAVCHRRRRLADLAAHRRRAPHRRGAAEADDPERLWEQLDRVGKVRFHRLLRASIADIRGGADALSEIDFGKLCREHGFPEPRRQVRRQDGRGRWRFLDTEWDLPGGGRLVVEIDGIGHMEATRWYDDLLRDAELVPNDRTVTIRLPASAARIEPLRVVRILERYLPRA
ncbi:hypothetical protein NKG05_08230 [Oerskovia sp. M15]